MCQIMNTTNSGKNLKMCKSYILDKTSSENSVPIQTLNIEQ